MGPTCLFRRSQRVVERRRVCVVEIGYWPFLDSSVLYIMFVVLLVSLEKAMSSLDECPIASQRWLPLGSAAPPHAAAASHRVSTGSAAPAPAPAPPVCASVVAARAGASLHALGDPQQLMTADGLDGDATLVACFGQTHLGAGRQFLHDVHVAAPRTLQWRAIAPRVAREISNELVNPGMIVDHVQGRADHGSCVVGHHFDRLFFFGGRTSMHSSGLTDETLVLSDAAGAAPQWMPLFAATAPCARRGLTLTPRADDRQKIFMFGGQRGHVCLEDLWVVRMPVHAVPVSLFCFVSFPILVSRQVWLATL
jgi:hypothetical protein